MLSFEMQQSCRLDTTQIFIMANQRVIYEKILNAINLLEGCVFKAVL